METNEQIKQYLSTKNSGARPVEILKATGLNRSTGMTAMLRMVERGELKVVKKHRRHTIYRLPNQEPGEVAPNPKSLRSRILSRFKGVGSVMSAADVGRAMQMRKNSWSQIRKEMAIMAGEGVLTREEKGYNNVTYTLPSKAPKMRVAKDSGMKRLGKRQKQVMFFLKANPQGVEITQVMAYLGDCHSKAKEVIDSLLTRGYVKKVGEMYQDVDGKEVKTPVLSKKVKLKKGKKGLKPSIIVTYGVNGTDYRIVYDPRPAFVPDGQALLTLERQGEKDALGQAAWHPCAKVLFTSNGDGGLEKVLKYGTDTEHTREALDDLVLSMAQRVI